MSINSIGNYLLIDLLLKIFVKEPPPCLCPPTHHCPQGSPNDQAVNAALLAATGFFIGGPSSMISSAISADLGRQEALRGSQEALATVTGIVDGTGSIGAAGGQVKLKHWGKKTLKKNVLGAFMLVNVVLIKQFLILTPFASTWCL